MFESVFSSTAGPQYFNGWPFYQYVEGQHKIELPWERICFFFSPLSDMGPTQVLYCYSVLTFKNVSQLFAHFQQLATAE